MKIKDYARAGFTSELLPILPPDAVISEHSRHPEHVRQNRGKVPGKRASDGWVGFADWAGQVTSEDDVGKWSYWEAGLGLQGREYPGIDIDVLKQSLADVIEVECVFSLGFAPARFGRGARRLLVYRGAGFKKRRLAFTVPPGNDAADGPGDQPGRGLGDGRAGADAAGAALPAAAGETYAVELLGEGQQYVVEGIHPKTGKPYYWRGGESPVEYTAEGLTVITAEEIEAFFAKLEWWLVMIENATIVTASSGSTGHATIAQETLAAPAVESVAQALAAIPNTVDYDTWLKVGMAVKAACGEEGYAAWEDWSLQWSSNTPETTRGKWESFHAPYRIGWPWLGHLATKHGFNAAGEDFPPIAAEAQAKLDKSAEAARGRGPGGMMERCVWVKKLEQVCDTHTLELMSRTQFNVAYRAMGSIASSRDCAWTKFLDNPTRRAVQSMTYRPGGPLFVYEEEDGGPCVNLWKPATGPLPTHVTDEQVRPYLDHLEYLFPVQHERETLLDWLAWVIQHPGLKPNWGLLIGSLFQGNGKSILLEPLRRALGRHNVKNVSADDLASGFTDWLVETKVFVVEEMHSFERTSTMNKLKNYLATPPDRLRINKKYGAQFEIPNLVAGVFFTNHEDALALERNDRRFYILWTEAQPKPADYYRRLVPWLKGEGGAFVARWLLERDVSAFDAFGRAPDTLAKDDMRKAGRGLLDEWLEDGIADELTPFDVDLIATEDVYSAMPGVVAGRRGMPTRQRVAAAMKRLGAVTQGRVRIGDQRLTLVSIRRHSMFASLPNDKLAALYLKQAQDAEKRSERLRNEF